MVNIKLVFFYISFSENSSHSDLRDLLSELDLLKKLKPHPNVIQLKGCLTKDVIRCKGKRDLSKWQNLCKQTKNKLLSASKLVTLNGWLLTWSQVDMQTHTTCFSPSFFPECKAALWDCKTEWSATLELGYPRFQVRCNDTSIKQKRKKTLRLCVGQPSLDGYFNMLAPYNAGR